MKERWPYDPKYDASSGSVFKRGVVWAFDVSIAGKRVRRSGFDSQKQAEEALEEARLRSPLLHLQHAGEAYLRSLRGRGKASSIAIAEVHLRTLERVMGGHTDLSQLSVVDVDRFVQARLAEGVSPSTINGNLRILRAIIRRAHEEGRISTLPRVKMLKEQRRLPSILSPEEVERLLQKADPTLRAVLLLAGDAGLRHQEIVHLAVSDVDLEDGRIQITAKGSWSPKNHQERVVYLTRRLHDALEDYLPAVSGQSWLFPGYDGQPRTDFSEEIRNVFKDAGLYDEKRKPGLHMLRRTCASNMLGAGVDIQTVREIMAWADLQTPMSYLASTDDRKRAAMAALEGKRSA